ncbi:MAG: DUF4488 domain-containing protein [Bacteroidaceae bacterium]
MKIPIKTAVSAFALFLCLSFSGSVNAKKLSGMWKYKTSSDSKTIIYKIFTKDGRYMNICSLNGGNTYYVKQKGLYENLTPGLYIEHLGASHQNPNTCGSYMISYKKIKGKLQLSFQLGKNVYNEVWEKVKEVHLNLPLSCNDTF